MRSKVFGAHTHNLEGYGSGPRRHYAAEVVLCVVLMIDDGPLGHTTLVCQTNGWGIGPAHGELTSRSRIVHRERQNMYLRVG